MGMDSAIIRHDGEAIFFTASSIEGSKVQIARKLVSDLAERIISCGSRPILINPVVLLPVRTEEVTARQLLRQISKTAAVYGITIGKGHTEVTPIVREIFLIATVFG
jgi:hydrogenase expression/formation protein HypE